VYIAGRLSERLISVPSKPTVWNFGVPHPVRYHTEPRFGESHFNSTPLRYQRQDLIGVEYGSVVEYQPRVSSESAEKPV